MVGAAGLIAIVGLLGAPQSSAREWKQPIVRQVQLPSATTIPDFDLPDSPVDAMSPQGSADHAPDSVDTFPKDCPGCTDLPPPPDPECGSRGGIYIGGICYVPGRLR